MYRRTETYIVGLCCEPARIIAQIASIRDIASRIATENSADSVTLNWIRPREDTTSTDASLWLKTRWSPAMSSRFRILLESVAKTRNRARDQARDWCILAYTTRNSPTPPPAMPAGSERICGVAWAGMVGVDLWVHLLAVPAIFESDRSNRALQASTLVGLSNGRTKCTIRTCDRSGVRLTRCAIMAYRTNGTLGGTSAVVEQYARWVESRNTRAQWRLLFRRK